MFPKPAVSNALSTPVAILDKGLPDADSFHIEVFELCSHCGARFGIGFFGPASLSSRLGPSISSSDDRRAADAIEDLPRKLTQILAKDHWQNREHKEWIDLDF